MSTVPIRSATASPAPAAARAQPLPSQLTDQPKWHALLGAILAIPLPSREDSTTITRCIHPDIVPAIDEAFDAGLATGTGLPTNYNIIPILEAMDCQPRYYHAGMVRGIHLRLAASASAPVAVPMNTLTQRDRAPKLNPPKPFDGTRSDYKTFIMQLNLIFNSDPDRYTGTNADNAKIAYSASYLSGSAKEWFQPHVNETTVTITLQTWASFVAALKAAFDDPDAY